MSKEHILTVLVPINDSDAEQTVYQSESALQNAVPASSSNKDKIYKIADGTYRRSEMVPSTGQYHYVTVIDREFPHLGNPLEIYDFTYSATRMGSAPTITAVGVMRYSEKDQNGEDVTLDEFWDKRCHVKFNGEDFYLKQVPTSSKSNDDARYKYDMDFVSERVILEGVYFYDIVQPFVTEKPISESATFSFYGDVVELAKRINASLIRSGLASLQLKSGVSDGDILTFEEWNELGMGTYSGNKPHQKTVPITPTESAIVSMYAYYRSNYNSYLQGEIYEFIDGEYITQGYKCAIGVDKKGEAIKSEEKIVSFDRNTIYEALQQIHDVFGLEYYIAKEKDSNSSYTGNTLIMVADCEYDFADWDEDEGDYVRDGDGVPTTETPFDYGVSDALLAKEKENTTDKIVTRITGEGSSDNIPWYYPNPNPDGWIKPVYKRDGEIQGGVTVDYPISEGTTVEESVRYEKYLKNRIGVSMKRGFVMREIGGMEFNTSVGGCGDQTSQDGTVHTVSLLYSFLTKGVNEPEMTICFSLPSDAQCYKFEAGLVEDIVDEIGEYDSSETYLSPTEFQSMMGNHNGRNSMHLTIGKSYLLFLQFYTYPQATQKYDYLGYYYDFFETTYEQNTGNSTETYTDGEGTHIFTRNVKAYVGSNFYELQDLKPIVLWDIKKEYKYGPLGESGYWLHTIKPIIGGYSLEDGKIVSPIPRFEGKVYKRMDNGSKYTCNTSNQCNIEQGSFKQGFDTQNPIMGFEEWIESYLNFSLKLHSNDGWYIGYEKIQLSDYGIGSITQNSEEVQPTIFDEIDFRRLKYITPQKRLMPEVYVMTDGERRYYDAHNYWDRENETLYVGTADPAIGELQFGSKVRNPIYKEKESDPDSKHYEFENEYIVSLPHEHIEVMDDVKPTIEGQTNYVVASIGSDTVQNWEEEYVNYFTKNQDGSYANATSEYDQEETYYILVRIDVVEEFGYDVTDNDDIWETTEDGNPQGEYKHPYFFAKLRPLGFNIFDLALQEDMVLSMTTGHCGACNFKIGVDENTRKNPVQIWEHDVYDGEPISSSNKLYSKGDLRRYTDTSGLYYDVEGTAVPITKENGVSYGGWNDSVSMFEPNTYSADAVTNGEVGCMKQDGKNHFEGDVVTGGRFIDSQQDTSSNYVWVALMKDVDTYGTIMPSARQNYANPLYNVYIRPKSIADVHAVDSSNEDDEDLADKFVLLNIRMPQAYLRNAERNLSRRLVAYMYDNNYEKFNFSINFSRIFLADRKEIDDVLNENSVLYIRFNRTTFRQYVKNYTYKIKADDALPEIGVELNQELSVTRTFIENQNNVQKKNISFISSQIGNASQQIQYRLSRNTIGKNDNVVSSGNIILRSGSTSIVEMAKNGLGNASDIESMRTELEVGYYKRSDFKVENGNDLNIGGEVLLPTAFNSGGKMERRRWDYQNGRFVEDDSQTFAPAFIDEENDRVVDYKAEYVLLETEPPDWEQNYQNYFKFDRGAYNELDAPESFVSDTYYRRVDGVVKNYVEIKELEWGTF